MMLRKNRSLILASLIYAAVFLLFVCKVNFYQTEVGHFTDEAAHAAFIYYLEASGEIIPEYRDIPPAVTSMDENSLTDRLHISEGTNNLCHPPLYYLVMRMSSGIRTVDGRIFMNINALRDFSQCFAYAGILIAFYIGLSRLRRWQEHMLYALLVTSVPMMAYNCAGLNNDTFSLLSLMLYFLALLRLSEQKRSFGTYVLLLVSIVIGVLSKMTVGLVLLAASGCYIVYCILREHSASIILNRKFMVTLPFYLIAGSFYLVMLMRYGKIRPSVGLLNPEYFVTTVFYVAPENRVQMSLSQYVVHYMLSFGRTWTTISSHIDIGKPGNLTNITQIGVFSILLLPLLSLRSWKRGEEYKTGAMCIYLGVGAAIVYQLYNGCKGFLRRGYLGGFQSRYYLCALPVMAMLITLAARDRADGFIRMAEKCGISGKIARSILTACLILFCVLLVYEDFIYVLLNYSN